jgi:hypothetical protein
VAVVAAIVTLGVGGVEWASTPPATAAPVVAPVSETAHRHHRHHDHAHHDRHLTLRFVTQRVRQSFTQKLRRQVKMFGDVVRVRGFTCLYDYRYHDAIRFTCHAQVRIRATGPQRSAIADDVGYWILVVETDGWLRWRLEAPDVCSQRSYGVC